MKKADEQKKEEQLRQFIQSLASLVNLKELRLFGLSPTERYLVLTLIGKSCPSLTHLSVNGAKMCKKDILALVLGEFINNLYDSEEEPSWCEDGGVETLVIPSEFRTPICFTLQELRLIKEENSKDIESAAAICPSTAAFTVSNFPLLVQVDKRIPINIGTVCLYIVEKESQEEFLTACQNAAERNGKSVDEFYYSHKLNDAASPGK